MVDEATFERLAALEHDRWSGWMKYMIANLTLENLTRWLRQMETPYRDLSEREKESDRKEVRRALEILGALPPGRCCRTCWSFDRCHGGDYCWNWGPRPKSPEPPDVIEVSRKAMEEVAAGIWQARELLTCPLSGKIRCAGEYLTDAKEAVDAILRMPYD